MDLTLEITADSRYRFNRKQIKQAVENLLKEQGVSGKVALSLAMVGDRKIRQLKQKYLGIDEVTDVLSFSQLEGDGKMGMLSNETGRVDLGDVVVCYPQAKRQAVKLNRLLDDEIEFLVCHGVLHLLGVHH
ncbi:rRNA maturation RNase YbeY [Candidatus Collierbacteria bacterium]|nr:rRNA maturation RNase YbeY [Candidatus Collierbacteria bacterium]